MIISHKLTLAAILALGITAPVARVATDRTPVHAQRATATFAAPPLAHAPQPAVDDAVAAELDRAAAELAADVAGDRVRADLSFQLGRLDALLSTLEHDR